MCHSKFQCFCILVIRLLDLSPCPHTHTHTHTVRLFCSAITMLHKCGKVRSSVHFPDCRRTSSDTSPGYTTGGVLVAPDALPCPYHPVGVPQQCASADVTSANNRKRDTIIPHSLTLKQSEPKKNQFRRITGSETKNLDREVVSDCQLKATLSHFEMRGPGFRYLAVTEVKHKRKESFDQNGRCRHRF